MEHAGGFFAGVGRSNAAGYLRTGAASRVAGVAPNLVACLRAKGASVARSFGIKCSAAPSSSAAGSAFFSIGTSSHAGLSLNGSLFPNLSCSCFYTGAPTRAASVCSCYAASTSSPTDSEGTDSSCFIILPSPGDSALRGNVDAGRGIGAAIPEATACSSALEAEFVCFFILPTDTARLSTKEPAFEGSSAKKASIATSYSFAPMVNASAIRAATLLRFTGPESSTRMESAGPNSYFSILGSARCSSASAIAYLCAVPASVAHGFAIADASSKKSLGEMESAPPNLCYLAYLPRCGRSSSAFLPLPRSSSGIYLFSGSATAEFFTGTYLCTIAGSPVAGPTIGVSGPVDRGVICYLNSPMKELFRERVKFASEARGFFSARTALSSSSCLNISPRLTCNLFGTCGSWRGKARMPGKRCYAATNDRASTLNWEHFARVCLLCALLHRAGYFNLPTPSHSAPQAPESNWMVKILQRVTFLLLLQCLFIGYYAATGDRKMKLLVDAA